MGTLTLEECEEGKESQQWTVMEDGRIALTASNPRKSPALPSWHLDAFIRPQTF